MKKLLLSLAAITATTTPIVAITSCGKDESPKKVAKSTTSIATKKPLQASEGDANSNMAMESKFQSEETSSFDEMLRGNPTIKKHKHVVLTPNPLGSIKGEATITVVGTHEVAVPQPRPYVIPAPMPQLTPKTEKALEGKPTAKDMNTGTALEELRISQDLFEKAKEVVSNAKTEDARNKALAALAKVESRLEKAQFMVDQLGLDFGSEEKYGIPEARENPIGQFELTETNILRENPTGIDFKSEEKAVIKELRGNPTGIDFVSEEKAELKELRGNPTGTFTTETDGNNEENFGTELPYAPYEFRGNPTGQYSTEIKDEKFELRGNPIGYNFKDEDTTVHTKDFRGNPTGIGFKDEKFELRGTPSLELVGEITEANELRGNPTGKFHVETDIDQMELIPATLITFKSEEKAVSKELRGNPTGNTFGSEEKAVNAGFRGNPTGQFSEQMMTTTPAMMVAQPLKTNEAKSPLDGLALESAFKDEESKIKDEVVVRNPIVEFPSEENAHGLFELRGNPTGKFHVETDIDQMELVPSTPIKFVSEENSAEVSFRENNEGAESMDQDSKVSNKDLSIAKRIKNAVVKIFPTLRPNKIPTPMVQTSPKPILQEVPHKTIVVKPNELGAIDSPLVVPTLTPQKTPSPMVQTSPKPILSETPKTEKALGEAPSLKDLDRGSTLESLRLAQDLFEEAKQKLLTDNSEKAISNFVEKEARLVRAKKMAELYVVDFKSEEQEMFGLNSKRENPTGLFELTETNILRGNPTGINFGSEEISALYSMRGNPIGYNFVNEEELIHYEDYRGNPTGIGFKDEKFELRGNPIGYNFKDEDTTVHTKDFRGNPTGTFTTESMANIMSAKKTLTPPTNGEMLKNK